MTKSITTVGVRDAIKDILDMATKAVEAVNKISDAFGKFGTIGLGIGITSFIKQMANFGKIDFTKFTVLPNLFSGIGSAFNILKTSIASNGIKAGLAEAGTGLMGLVKSSGLAKTALVGLKSVLTGLAWGVAIAGVVALGKALYDNAHKTEQFIEKSKEQQDIIMDNMKSLSSQKSSLSEIASEYDTLAKKTNKSAEELQRFSELKKQIAEISPELVSGYDVNGDPILKLNESLTSYMSDLDVAIEKQQKLYNQKNAEQAYAYATENGKKKGSGTAFSYNQKRNNIDNVMQDTAGEYKEWYQNLLNLNDESAQQMAKNRLRYEEKANERITNLRAELAEKEAKYQEQNLAMQSSVLNKVMNNTDSKLALESTKATESFQGLIASMDWGSLDFTQLTSMERGMQKLALVTKGSTNDMGEYTDKIKNANKEFKNTGDVEAWGKALQENSKVNFDNTSWSAYLKEVNQQYEEGATSTEQYNNQLKYMAQTISDLTGVDMNTVWQSLTGSYDAQARLDSMSSGLNNFLKAYNKTATDIRNGDSMAIELEKQFNAIKDFGSNLEIQIDTTGKVNVDWLLEQKENLPQQMQKVIDVVTKDNKVTEVEQKLLMTCQMQIQNEGKLSDDLTKQLEGIFDGSIDISNGITIEGIEFNKEEALALKEALAGCVDESGKLNLSDTGIEKLAQQAKEVEKALSSLGKGKLRVEFEKQGIKDNVEEINSLKSALEKIPKKQQLDFVTECGSAFNNVKTLEEGIKKIPPEKKLKFNIGVDGNKELESAREKLKNLPESIRTMVYNKVIGLNDLETAQKLVNKFGNEKATAILSISGIEEALSEATTFEELLQILTTEEWETKISAECEGADAIIKALEGELDKLTKNDKNIKIKTEKEETTIKKEKKEQSTQKTEKITKDVDADTSKAKNKTDKLEKDINNKKPKMEVDADTSKAEKKTQKLKEETEGKKPKMEVDTDTSGVEKGNKAVEEFKQNVEKNGKGKLKVNTDTTEVEKGNVTLDEFKKNVEENGRGNVKVSADTTEVEQAEKKVESLTTVDKQGIITLHVNGNEEVKASINDKKQLEVNGQAITMVQVDGGEQYSVAINEKGQLEVDGQALTKLDVTNLDSLTFAKNEKGELEVNGKSITDLIVNGKEEPKEAKKNVDELTKAGNKNVKVNIDVSLKDTVGEILSRLGLNKKTEKVEIQVTCKDEATPVINKITNTNNKQVTVNITCNDQASTTIDKINSAPGTKTINVAINCTNGANVLNTVHQIANTQISTKQFSIICNDSATGVLSQVKGNNIPDKPFTINCTDNATSVVNKVIGIKIPNKSFTVSCTDNASSKLSSIISKLSSIHSKSVTVTTRYSTIGKPPSGTVPSANEPEIIELQPSFGSGTTQSLDAQTQAISNQAQVLSDEVKPLQDNVADVMATKPIKANIDTKSTVTALKYNVDLLNNMTNIISKLSIEISKLDSKMERAWGTSKSKLLKEQISLLTKQQNLTKTNIKNMEGMSKSLKSSLKKQGFKFKDDGSISNYNSKLIAMEKNVEKLEKKEEAYNKKYKNTSKLSKSKQKAVEKKQEANSKATEKARKQLELTKQKLQEYYDLQFNEMPNAKKDWEDLANSIAEAKGEIIKADREAKTFFEDVREEIKNAYFDRNNTYIETLEIKADLSGWGEAQSYLKQAEKWLLENQRLQEGIKENAKNRAKDNKSILDKYGFKYSSSGAITNAEKNLEKLRKKLSPSEYEAVKEAYDSYINDICNTIPNAEKEWWSLQQSIEENRKSIEETNKAMKEMIDEAKVSVLTSKFDSLSKSLDLIEAKMERVYGANKIYYMENEIELLEQMQNANREIIAQNEILASQTKSILSGYGIIFDSSGNITNLSNALNGLDDLDKMEELKDLADKYNEYKGAVDDATISIEEEKNKIIELEDSMKKLEQEMKELKDQAWIKEFENGIKLIQNKVDKLDSELNISGSNQIKLLNEKIKAYEKLAIATENSLAYQEKRKRELSKTLISYGFEINDDGTINNTANKLESLKNTLSDVEFEIVSDALEGYFEVALDTIPELEKELLNYQKELQDIQKTKLEKTQNIEKEITKIYEKQIEDRKKLIEEEADAQIKALNKAKDAYQRYRDEVDYRDDYEEQLKKVEDLQKKLEIAKRDDSLSGAKRVADLQEQLLEEQKNLEKLVQDKIDNDINNMFDDQMDKIQTDADEEVKKLEDTWTESKIAEAVQQALDTGIFTSIDGEIKSLNTALIEFANTSSDYFGVMGAVLKTELIDNLKVAYSTMDEIQKIYNDLGASNFSNVNSLPNVNIQGSVAGTPINNNTITIGDTNITVEGNADSQTVEEIELMLKDYQQKIYADIMKNVK